MKRLLFVVLYIGKYSPILHMCQKDPRDYTHLLHLDIGRATLIVTSNRRNLNSQSGRRICK